ncbi:MAG: hypothetical protein JXP73_12150, partial [Deltaproteobacteria bacterium]|nr:hypothetical protein [Deltaproteobacteria bacterium]
MTDPPHGVLRQQAWDVLPSMDVWREIFRVLKPGAAVVVICAAQTYHLMVPSILAAGFEFEDMLVWGYATGRPPSPNRLKPAHHPILIARKPGPKLPMNIDRARLEFVDDEDRAHTKKIDTLRGHGHRRAGVFDRSLDSDPSEAAPFAPKAGRWPANLMLTEPVLGVYDRFFLVPVVRDRHGHP